jgi:hypothetical protein
VFGLTPTAESYEMSAYRDELEAAGLRVADLEGQIAERDTALAHTKRVLSATEADLERVRSILSETVARSRPAKSRRAPIIAVALPLVLGAVTWAWVERARADESEREAGHARSELASLLVDAPEAPPAAPAEAAPCPTPSAPLRTRACCTVLAANADVAPIQYKGRWSAAAAACRALPGNASDRKVRDTMRAILEGMPTPEACL